MTDVSSVEAEDMDTATAATAIAHLMFYQDKQQLSFSASTETYFNMYAAGNWYGRGSELKGGGIPAAGDTMTWAEVSGDTHFFTSLSATIGLDMKVGVIGGDMNISLPTFIQISVTNNEKYSTLTEMKAGGVQGVKNAFDYGATVAGLHAKAVDNSTDATDLDATTVEPSINAANNDLAAGNLENPPVPVPPAAAVAAVGVAGAAAASEAAAKNLDTAAAAASKSAKEAAQKAVSEQASTAVSTAAKEAAEKAAENARTAAEAAAAAREAAQKQVDAIADAQSDALNALADAAEPDAATIIKTDTFTDAADDLADASNDLDALADAAEPDTDSIIVTDTFDDTIDAAGDGATDGATDVATDGAGDAVGDGATDGATDVATDGADDVVDTTEELSTKALEEMKKTADEILKASEELANFADVVSKQADEASTLAGEAAKLADDASELADQVDDLTSALKFLEDSGADADSIADVSRELKLAEDALTTAQKAADDAAANAAKALENLDELSDQFSRATWTTSIPDNVGLWSAVWAGNFGSRIDYLKWVVFGGVPEVVGWYKYDYGDGSWDGERDTSGFSTTYQAGDTNPSTGQTAYLEDAEGRTEIGTDSDNNPLYWE